MYLYCIVQDPNGGYSNEPTMFCGTFNGQHKFLPIQGKVKPKIWTNENSARRRKEAILANPDSNRGYLNTGEIYIKQFQVSVGNLIF